MNRKQRYICIALLVLGLTWLTQPQPLFAQGTFTVNTVDDLDDGNCNTNHCSLREALQAANAAPDSNTISFAIGEPGSQQVILLNSPLPSLTQPVTIDGWSQGGANHKGPPLIELNGTNMVPDMGRPALGLRIDADNVIVRGLAIVNIPTDMYDLAAILVAGDNAWIYGNYIGLRLDGTTVGSNPHGVRLSDQFNLSWGGRALIGTNGDGVDDVAERNVISGNRGQGIYISDLAATIAGNYIGTDATGSATRYNGQEAIRLVTSGNHVGVNGDGSPGEAHEGNVINTAGIGVFIVNEAAGNVIAGNLIGTDKSGTIKLSGGEIGVSLSMSADSNRIGTNSDGVSDELERNIIAGFAYGIRLAGYLTILPENNVIAGNYIGPDITGARALGNSHGIALQEGARRNRIGSNGDGVRDDLERNVISGNSGVGIWLRTGASQNHIAGNYIGVDASGTSALPNNSHGILMQSSANNNIIGTNGDGSAGDPNEGNVISSNGGRGLHLDNVHNNVIAGNSIGTDVTGLLNLGNADMGIALIGSSSNNRIGTNADGISDTAERNVISGNKGSANIQLSGGGVTNNVVAGNYIGLDHTGLASVSPNGGQRGFQILAPGNLIGGASPAARNVIGGHTNNALQLQGTNANHNRIQGNFIGVDANGTQIVSNSGAGILLYNAPNNTIGTDSDGVNDANEGNVISGNNDAGVWIQRGPSVGNVVAGNRIGTDLSGVLELGNGSHGVLININASSNRIGGDDAVVEGNLIAFNTLDGITIDSEISDGNALLGNRIFQNGGIGIDLRDDGRSANDGGDADTGPNQRQNWPVIAGTGDYFIDSIPGNSAYPLRIEFFAVDVDGQEGQTFLGFDTYSEADYSGCGAVPCAKALPAALSSTLPIVAIATDANNNSSEFSDPIIVVSNGAPVANAGGPYGVDEGGSVTLDASGSSDAEQDPATLIYEWDFDNDGAYDDASGVAPIFSVASLDGPTMVMAGLRVSDNGGLSSTSSAAITVNNVAPIIAEVSNDAPILVGGSAVITVNASDPAGTADPLRYEFDCNNDGTFEVGPQAEPTTSCPFASVGEFTVPVRVADDDDGLATGLTVVSVMPLPDTTPPDTSIDTLPDTPSDSSEASFTFSGSDDVTVADALAFECQLNGGGFTSCTSPQSYSGLADGEYTFQVRAIDEAGNSDPTPASHTWIIDAIPDGGWIGECGGYQVYLHEGVYHARGWEGNILVGTAAQNNLVGTAGNDLILGLGGNDILNGKAGDDVICGGEGNDLIYGELGNDYLDGGNHNDVLNGGTGDYDVLIGGEGNDTLLDPDGVADLQGGPGNDQINLSLHAGWRDEAGAATFVQRSAAGLGNDTVTFGILGSDPFLVDITGDEWADMDGEGTADTIRFAGRIDQANAHFRKFEGQVIIAASELPLITDETGLVFWVDEPVAEQPDAALTYHLYLSMVSN